MKSNWIYKKIGDVCHILNGFAFKSDNYVDNGIRIMRITNVQKGEVVDDAPKYYPVTDSAKISQFLLKENDLLMSLTGNVGRVGLLPKEMLPAALNQRVACIRIKDSNLLLKFLFHKLNSNAFEQDCIYNATGIAQKNMSTEWLKSVSIPLPPKETQVRIVSELDSINDSITMLQQQVKDLDALTQSIFLEMFGDPLGNPKHFDIIYLKNCSEFKNGINFSKNENGNEYKFLGVSDFGDKYTIKECDLSSIHLTEALDKEYYLKENDIVFVRSNGSKSMIGRSVLIQDIISPTTFSGFCIRCRLVKDTVIPIYLLYLLKTDAIVKHITSSGRGCNINNLNQKILGEIPVMIPDLFLQESFARKISSIEEAKTRLNSQIAETQTMLAARIQYWFD